MSEETRTDAEILEEFFRHLQELADWYIRFTGELPKSLVVNPDIIGELARRQGFYQRPELAGIVPAHSPVVRTFHLKQCVVTLVDSYAIKFLHFE